MKCRAIICIIIASCGQSVAPPARSNDTTHAKRPAVGSAVTPLDGGDLDGGGTCSTTRRECRMPFGAIPPGGSRLDRLRIEAALADAVFEGTVLAVGRGELPGMIEYRVDKIMGDPSGKLAKGVAQTVLPLIYRSHSSSELMPIPTMYRVGATLVVPVRIETIYRRPRPDAAIEMKEYWVESAYTSVSTPQVLEAVSPCCYAK